MNDLPGFRRPLRGVQPDNDYPPYASTIKRAPKQPLIFIPHTLSEITGPVFGHGDVKESDSDLTIQHAGGEAMGQRIIVSGRVLDENARPVPNALLEIWQANAAGRYHHRWDQHGAPLDPFFSGYGRVLTDSQGHYRFVSIKPGSYPWGNHYNAWRPAHIHFSIFGAGLLTRVVTQMYFPGDPLMPFDPIFNSIPDEKSRNRLISSFNWETTVPEHALGFKWDIILRGRESTPFEKAAR